MCCIRDQHYITEPIQISDHEEFVDLCSGLSGSSIFVNVVNTEPL